MKKLTDTVTFRHGATIKSRTCQTPMLTNSGLDGKVTDDTLKYYNARSDSAGMVLVEYTYVTKAGGPSRSWAKDRTQLAIYDDSFMEGHKKLAQALKKEGNKAILQLVHSGREANWADKYGETAQIPSAVDYPWIDWPLHELTEEETWGIVKDFGKATKRAIDCGYDGVEIHGANHYLIQEFFSAFSNKRNDYFGGSLEKRMNFPLEVTKEVMRVVKEYAPKDFIVGYRISPEEIHGENIGYTWHESTQLVKKLTGTFDLDYIHLSLLDYKEKPVDSDQTLAELLGHEIVGDCKEIVAGDISTTEKRHDALNYMDIIGMGRSTLIDPQIQKKILAGKEDEILTSLPADALATNPLTPGLIELFSNPLEGFTLPGIEQFKDLCNVTLGDDVLHQGANG